MNGASLQEAEGTEQPRGWGLSHRRAERGGMKTNSTVCYGQLPGNLVAFNGLKAAYVVGPEGFAK